MSPRYLYCTGQQTHEWLAISNPTKNIQIIDVRKYHFIRCTLRIYQQKTPSILFTWLIFCSPTPSPAKPFTGSRRYLFQMYLSFGALLYATKEGKDRLSILALLALSGMAWYYKSRDDYTSISIMINKQIGRCCLHEFSSVCSELFSFSSSEGYWIYTGSCMLYWSVLVKSYE